MWALSNRLRRSSNPKSRGSGILKPQGPYDSIAGIVGPLCYGSALVASTRVQSRTTSCGSDFVASPRDTLGTLSRDSGFEPCHLAERSVRDSISWIKPCYLAKSCVGDSTLHVTHDQGLVTLRGLVVSHRSRARRGAEHRGGSLVKSFTLAH